MTGTSYDGQKVIIQVTDKGELLILRRALSGLNEAKEEQRENIFQSRSTIREKVCSLIIDG